MPGATFLKGDQISLRLIDDADTPFLYATVNDPRISPLLFIQEKPPYSREQEREWIDRVNSREDTIALLICVDGDACGSVQLTDINRTVGTGTLSCVVAPTSQGHGYATAALRLLIRYAFDELRLHKLTARTYDINDPSRRVLEKLGFVEEGVHREEGFHEGEYRDVHYYGLINGEMAEPAD